MRPANRSPTVFLNGRPCCACWTRKIRPTAPDLNARRREPMPTILLSEAMAARYGDRITASPWFGPGWRIAAFRLGAELARSEEHTSELQSLMRISYADFCLKKKNTHPANT